MWWILQWDKSLFCATRNVSWVYRPTRGLPADWRHETRRQTPLGRLRYWRRLMNTWRRQRPGNRCDNRCAHTAAITSPPHCPPPPEIPASAGCTGWSTATWWHLVVVMSRSSVRGKHSNNTVYYLHRRHFDMGVSSSGKVGRAVVDSYAYLYWMLPLANYAIMNRLQFLHPIWIHLF